MSVLRPHEIKRFWSKVERAEGCWHWTGELNSQGYGRFATWSGERRSRHLAHRLAYELAVGPLGDRVARHRCDNPPCCNPSHIEPGTRSDNMRDAVERGRANLSGLEAHRLRRDDAAAEARAAGDSALLAQIKELMRIGLTLDAAHDVARGDQRRLSRLREALAYVPEDSVEQLRQALEAS